MAARNIRNGSKADVRALPPPEVSSP
jgi:hypothetical protein